MKKWFLAAFAALTLFGLTACGDKTPETVAHDYVQAIYDGDAKTAAGLVYLSEKEKAEPGIDNAVQGKLQGMISDIKNKTAEFGGVKNVVAEQAVIDADNPNRAKVRVNVTFKKSDFVDTTNIRLLKVEKEGWKVKM